ncbi:MULTISPECIES: acetyl-CoA hydrolase/transferase family protein [Aneurinibacillus]|uniref:Acyl-CoA hydrolase n=1 Tax=Aneurinibacillus thermoaerophilus TaxID=143495 RepID=A0A1G7ZC98_ANETH|nr:MULTISPECIES: acetyl-CoA hydrolase/transferase C-terminal domain-containing protein [Aneurinibacillus]AMA73047.1 4-hydroxybutyrate CoA-transferase [Aneurinibacillus sp. XH2]MED0674913.1 acetyl-CoA hydrolase/transferase C-terminal domain-containing protein [Aneurinibacillus thermoaerophilus]MED0680403.1 acetyl-CoA hydrolase/transferase C-terminal domain-containing protein [Aneurinibacillus thermoaerophilus]MED0735901.1 acetyl-CoA hydrolase/transferase C-terminal domain-containing protein [Ane
MDQFIDLENKRKTPQDVLAYIKSGDDIIVPLANGEPLVLLDTIEKHAERWFDVRIHQMHALKERDYIHGKYRKHLRHVAYFLSGASRKAFLAGECDLVPNHFHEVPRLLRETTKMSLVLAAAAPMDEHGYFSLGTQADYVASFIGKVPFFLEVNPNMPRTFGSNQIHISQILGYIEVDYPLYEVKEKEVTDIDRKIAAYVVERIPNGATLQVGIGAIPNAIIGFLQDHKNLGIHTELITDGIVDLAEQGIVNGIEKKTHRGKIVGTFALGTKKLYDFIDENTSVEMLPVDYVNDPRIIGQEDNIVSINATTEVDFMGQCASETIAGRYYSSSGGQADFARGIRFAKNGKGFICLHSTTRDGSISRIRPQLTLGSVVTTSKNDVDHIVTEYGVASLRGKSIAERTKALLAIAHPKFREELEFEARKFGLLY